jgi:hypothetical protein
VAKIRVRDRSLLGQLDVLHIQNFKVEVPKGTPLVKVFKILSRNGFHGLKMVLPCLEGMI